MTILKNEILLNTLALKICEFRTVKLSTLLSLAFLCDWKHLIEFETAITDCFWKIEGNRIRCDRLENCIAKNKTFSNFEFRLGDELTLVRRKANVFPEHTTELQVCNHIVWALGKFTEFKIEKTVISTFPFKYSGPLDLPKIRDEYLASFGKEYAVFHKTA